MKSIVLVKYPSYSRYTAINRLSVLNFWIATSCEEDLRVGINLFSLEVTESIVISPQPPHVYLSIQYLWVKGHHITELNINIIILKEETESKQARMFSNCFSLPPPICVVR
jgi:hypothetical protein